MATYEDRRNAAGEALERLVSAIVANKQFDDMATSEKYTFACGYVNAMVADIAGQLSGDSFNILMDTIEARTFCRIEALGN